MTRRVLITISRTWDDWPRCAADLHAELAAWPDAVLVSGACPDGDADLERIWAAMIGMTREQAVRAGRIEQHPADWDRYGKSAGFRRNTEMAATLPDVCYAYIRNASQGATHCAGECDAQGVPVRRRLQGPVPAGWTADRAIARGAARLTGPPGFMNAPLGDPALESATDAILAASQAAWLDDAFALAGDDDGDGPVIESRFDGCCRACGQPWAPGELIQFSEDEGGWCHARC